MSRRLRSCLIFGALGLAAFVVGVPAGAAPGGVQDKKTEIAEVQEQLEDIRTEASVSYEEYDSALLGLNALDEQVGDTEGQLSQTEEDLDQAQKNLEAAAA